MRIRTLLAAAAMLLAGMQADAQFFMFGGSSASRDSLNRIAAADYADMLAKLGIQAPREGRQPNSQDVSKHPNYDELKANPYIFYPEALVTNAGKAVKNARMWNKVRRGEIVKMFEDEVYGRIPENVPSVTWQVKSEEQQDYQGIPVTVRTLAGVVDNSSYPSISVNIECQIMWPQSVAEEFSKSGVPVIMEFGFISTGGRQMMMPMRAGAGQSWQQMTLERGWACATINPSSIQADAGSGLTNGIIGLCNKGQHRQPTDWGALRAWGWGASRFIDYLETCPEFDATKTAIEGVSRYGKAALVAMAFEPRIAGGFIASSGKAGAAGWRRDCGESIGNIVSNEEYHWVCGNLIKYGAEPLTEADLPVDQHELIALCAPRACFISTGTFDGDKWQDVVGSFISAAKASEVYELLGCKGLGTDVFPGVDNDQLMEGPLAYRQHHGGHEAGPNWPYFLSYFANQVVFK
ncbi:MAG: acetylxylan esterase [Bacteroidaceae bacterium]|nr:acetylxylan esterase [Bacteroidaceae bacterium]